jgi:hypothetical protein
MPIRSNSMSVSLHFTSFTANIWKRSYRSMSCGIWKFSYLEDGGTKLLRNTVYHNYYKLKVSRIKNTAMQSTPKLQILHEKYVAFNSKSTGKSMPESKLNIHMTHFLELFITPCIIKRSTASRMVRCWCLEEINGNQQIYNNSLTQKWGHLISWTEAIFRGEKANVIIIHTSDCTFLSSHILQTDNTQSQRLKPQQKTWIKIEKCNPSMKGSNYHFKAKDLH